MLEVKGLKKAFGNHRAVDGITFSIGAGERFGLLGPNGAGKTTTISIICGSISADAGSVEIDGKPLSPNSHSLRQAIGYVPQELALIEDLSCLRNLQFFGGLYGLSSVDLQSRCQEALEIVGLQDRANDPIKTFSGGMKRRANLAAAILHHPKLLVLDEPTVGVDPQSRNAIYESVERLCDQGMALLYTTHYMEEVERLCPRLAIMDHGQFLTEGSLAEVGSQLPRSNRVTFQFDPAYLGETELSEEIDDLVTGIPKRLAELTTAGATVVGVQSERRTLENVFLHLTGKELRD